MEWFNNRQLSSEYGGISALSSSSATTVPPKEFGNRTTLAHT